METREIIIDNAQAIELQQAIIQIREETEPKREAILKLQEENIQKVKEIKEIEAELQSMEDVARKYRDKIIPILNEEVLGQLGEVEEIQSVEVRDGKIVIIVADMVELFRKQYIERQNNAKAEFLKEVEESKTEEVTEEVVAE